MFFCVVTKIYFPFQVGIGHNFQMNATGWKWKLSTCFGGDGISRIRNKTTLGLSPGVDLRFAWRADYVLPEVTGQVSFICYFYWIILLTVL